MDLNQEFDVKNIQLDIRSQSRTKISDSNSQCCQESDSNQKPLTTYDIATLVIYVIHFLHKIFTADVFRMLFR